jgi:hypothetical protein
MKVTPHGVGNFAKAAGRVAAKLAKMQSVLVDETTKNKRLSICQQCEYLENLQCTECECLVRAKAMLSTESCPKNKW